MRLLLLCLFTLTLGLFAADANNSESQVLALTQQLNQAIVHQDSATMEKLLSPDLLYTHSSGQFETKPQMIKAVMTSKSPITKIDFTQPTVRPHGDTVLVKARMDVFHGADVTHLDVLFVWQKIGSTWLLIGRQGTKVS